MILRVLAIFAIPALLVLSVFIALGFLWWPFWIIALPAAGFVVWLLNQRAGAAVAKNLDARGLGALEGERISNTVENLCLQSGIDQPDLLIIDTPSCNLAAVSCGRDSALITTTGMLETLGALELEGVIAHGLAKLANGASRYEVLAASTPMVTSMQRDWAREWGDGEAGVVKYDLSGVGLTRYPPGLRSALELIDERPTEVAGAEALGTAWLVPPADQRIPLDHRIEVLWEL